MIAITNAQNIGFFKQVTTSKKNLTPQFAKTDEKCKNDYMRISGHIWTRTIKTQDVEWNTKKTQYLYTYLLLKCVLCYPKSGNVAQHYKRVSRQISNDCLTLSVLGY